MHEKLKMHPEEAFMLFTKIYIWYANTKTPYTKLTVKEKEGKNFKHEVAKIFCISKHKVTPENIELYLLNSPEEDLAPHFKKKRNQSWVKSVDYEIYGYHPISAYDLKLLLNVIGIRMLHFIEN